MMNKTELTNYRVYLAKELAKTELASERLAHDLKSKKGMLKLIDKQLELMNSDAVTSENGKEEKEEV